MGLGLGELIEAHDCTSSPHWELMLSLPFFGSREFCSRGDMVLLDGLAEAGCRCECWCLREPWRGRVALKSRTSNGRCPEELSKREYTRGKGYLSVGVPDSGGHHFPTIHELNG